MGNLVHIWSINISCLAFIDENLSPDSHLAKEEFVHVYVANFFPSEIFI